MLRDCLPLRLEWFATGDMQPVVFWLMLGFIFISFSFFATYHSRYRGFFSGSLSKVVGKITYLFIFLVQDFLDNSQKFKGRGDIYHVNHGIVSGIAHNWLDLEHTKPCLTLDLWLSHRIPNFGRVGECGMALGLLLAQGRTPALPHQFGDPVLRHWTASGRSPNKMFCFHTNLPSSGKIIRLSSTVWHLFFCRSSIRMLLSIDSYNWERISPDPGLNLGISPWTCLNANQNTYSGYGNFWRDVMSCQRIARCPPTEIDRSL